MKFKRAALLATLFLLILGTATQSYADISNAAVLFLRIAPGARAAAMGEAFVAVADDATATHYNPAGLGASPLSKNWIEAKIPDEYRPLKGLAALKARGGSSYTAYDIWAITPKGLLRFDNRKWRSGEVRETRTDDNLSSLVSQYYGVTDKDELETLTLKVASDNNGASLQAVEAFRDSVLAIAPKDYKNLDQLKVGLDSLVDLYAACRINWENFNEAKARLADAKKGGEITETKMDRISFAVEKSHNRFIREQILMPYGAQIDGEMTAIASTGEAVVIGTTHGLYRYNGHVWQEFNSEGSLPSDSVLNLTTVGNSVMIGTDKGIARFNGLTVEPYAASANTPTGRVQAIGGDNTSNMWAVVDHDLYHFDGKSWSNMQPYTVTLDETPERIADKFAVYGTPSEKALFLKKLGGGSDSAAYPKMTPATTIAVPYLGEIKGRVNAIGVGMGKTVWLGTEYGIVYLDKDKWIMPGYRDVTVDSTTTVEAYAAKNQFWTADRRASYLKILRALNDLPGDAILRGTKLRVPASADIASWNILGYREVKIDSAQTITGLMTREKKLALEDRHQFVEILRTLNGLTGDDIPAGSKLRVPVAEDLDKWVLSGVTEVQVDSNTTAANFVSRSQDAAFADWLRNLNDITNDTIAAGTKLRVANRPVPEVEQMARYGQSMMFATTDGLVEYDGKLFRRSEFRGLSSAPARDMSLVKEQLWVAGDDRIVTSSRGRSEVSLMYVKWLPDLAPDLYYSFISFVKPTNSWGTIGGNITYLNYGSIDRRSEDNIDLGSFQSYDVAFTLAYGNSLSNRLKAGVAAKLIYSKLSAVGAGAEQGQGTSTGFALDFGLLYQMTPRLNWGLALTNLGPKMSYIDANQSDDLPRNLGFGFSYKLIQGTYTRLTATAEVNKLLVGLNQGFVTELSQVVVNTGAEFTYANLITGRVGYEDDEEGKIRVATVGGGLSPIDNLKFDFSWIPGGQNVALNNTLRYSLSFIF